NSTRRHLPAAQSQAGRERFCCLVRHPTEFETCLGWQATVAPRGPGAAPSAHRRTARPDAASTARLLPPHATLPRREAPPLWETPRAASSVELCRASRRRPEAVRNVSRMAGHHVAPRGPGAAPSAHRRTARPDAASTARLLPPNATLPRREAPPLWETPRAASSVELCRASRRRPEAGRNVSRMAGHHLRPRGPGAAPSAHRRTARPDAASTARLLPPNATLPRREAPPLWETPRAASLVELCRASRRRPEAVRNVSRMAGHIFRAFSRGDGLSGFPP